jgi:hypothetical protein
MMMSPRKRANCNRSPARSAEFHIFKEMNPERKENDFPGSFFIPETTQGICENSINSPTPRLKFQNPGV